MHWIYNTKFLKIIIHATGSGTFNYTKWNNLNNPLGITSEVFKLWVFALGTYRKWP